jgi:4-hydroxy-tetrahydrodipicolinate synthase
VVELTLEEAKGKVPIVAGAGGYNTADVITLVCELAAMGVDGIVSVSPYYNKPTQEGLYQHYKAIAAAAPLPLLLYSVQSRTGVNIEAATVKRLSEIDNIVGIKEASGSITQMGAILNTVSESFDVLSGDDSMALPLMALGGRGFISVISNETPAEMTQLARLCNEGNFVAARALHRRYLALMEANFIETNPGPVKAAMGLMGLLEPVWRLPLVAPKAETLARLQSVLETLGLVARVHAAARN